MIPALVSLLLTLLGVFAVVAPASAATEAPEDSPFGISGNVRSAGEPIEDATVTVTNGAFEGEATTDEDGRWRVPVPDKEGTFTIELELPSGVEAPEGFETSVEREFGAGNNLNQNFTLEAAERTTTSFWDQLASRAVTA